MKGSLFGRINQAFLLSFVLQLSFLAISVYAINSFYKTEKMRPDQKLSNELSVRGEELLMYHLTGNKEATSYKLYDISRKFNLHSIEIVADRPNLDADKTCHKVGKNLTTCAKLPSTVEGYYFVKSGAGSVTLKYKRTKLDRFNYNQFYWPVVLMLGVVFLLNVGSIYFFFNRFVTKQIKEVIKSIHSLKSGSSLESPSHIESTELIEIWKSVNEVVQTNKELNEDKNQMKVENEKAKLAIQICHDIRSPLAALDMIVSDNKTLPETDRIMVRNATRRIHQIADNILLENQRKQDTGVKTEMLSALVSPLLSEKRLQYRGHDRLEIETGIKQDNFDSFIKVDGSQFKRVLSNLIDNSAQALNFSGTIKIEFEKRATFIDIYVDDDGPGIQFSDRERVLRKGVSLAKFGGSGLGLSHAHEMIQEWDGTLKVSESPLGGARIHISLPSQLPPLWFTSKLTIRPKSTIVVIDDDASIHDIWDKHFLKFTSNQEVEILHFSNTTDFSYWYTQNIEKDMVLLFDYEILGSDESGLEVIQRHNLVENTFLVTSHFENSDVLNECIRLGIKLIPKSLTRFVPVEVNRDTECSSEAVLIDDDEMVHEVWQLKSKKKRIQLKSFYSTKDFTAQMGQISPRTKIYIDSNLGEECTGEEFAAQLKQKGFENLYLTTGKKIEKNETNDFFKEILGKTPPW